MEQAEYRVRLEVFEGPLDLLLHLIRTQEIDIYDIPIARITEQYLGYLDLMRELNVNLAGEFVAMAATLIHIKSKLLLPPDPSEPPDSPGEDPRRELVDRLLEHEQFKRAADLLHQRQILEDSIWVRGEKEFEEEEQEAVSATVFDLVAAFHRVLERNREKIVLQVSQEQVSLDQKLEEVRSLLRLRREFLFSHFLAQPVSRLSLAVTFFALLELARLRELRLLQEALFADIRIVAC